MKIKDISGKTDKDIKDFLHEKRDELSNLKLDNKMNKLKNTRSIFNTRKDIAKILTLMREKELAFEKDESAKESK